MPERMSDPECLVQVRYSDLRAAVHTCVHYRHWLMMYLEGRHEMGPIDVIGRAEAWHSIYYILVRMMDEPKGYYAKDIVRRLKELNPGNDDNIVLYQNAMNKAGVFDG